MPELLLPCETEVVPVSVGDGDMAERVLKVELAQESAPAGGLDIGDCCLEAVVGDVSLAVWDPVVY